jgi:hypothetical protein
MAYAALNEICTHSDPDLTTALERLSQAATLTALVVAAWQVARLLACHLLEHELARRATQPAAPGTCPQCGRRRESKGRCPRQITTLLGTLHWQRRVYRCPQGCASGQVVPLDRALGLQPQQRTSIEVQHLACLLAVFVPFDLVGSLLQRCCGVTVSPGAIWQWVQTHGQQAMQQLEDELTALEQGTAPSSEVPDEATRQRPLLIGADGVMAPFRPQEGTPKGATRWREVKVGILARLGQRRTRRGEPVTRLEQRRVVAVLGDTTALQARLWLEAQRQAITSSPTVVWISDGARGLWNIFAARFASYAIGVLDFYHVMQNIWQVLQTCARKTDACQAEARRWFAWMWFALRRGKQDEVLAEIQRGSTMAGFSPAQQAELSRLAAYLERHREHIDYQRYKELGLPTGSGMVESTCKWLIQQRFKGVGMRWSEDGFNHLLHLRLCWVNGRFDALFPGVPPN